MASSRKSQKNSTLLERFTAVLRAHVAKNDRVMVGLSGGVDSVVLLDLLARRVKTLGFRLTALHVDHQINPASRHWAAFCRKLCRELAIQCTVVRVKLPRVASLEAAARAARYQAYARPRVNLVALAHNLDDQAETAILQLLRGAGVKGLSAMPVLRQLQSGAASARGNQLPAIFRPLLGFTRAEIEAYARDRGLSWVEDDSNTDVRFDRNFVRHELMPIIARRYPAYRTTLARASANAAETARLLDDLAASDVGARPDALSLCALRLLTPERAKNAVRYFLAGRGVSMPNAKRLEECVRQLLQPAGPQRMVVNLGGYELRRDRDQLRLVSKLPRLISPRSWRWQGEDRMHLAELGGTLVFKKGRGSGISLERLLAEGVSVRTRAGGERFWVHLQRPRRSLKNLLQEAQVPPWERPRLPLLFGGETLVYVPNLGIDPRYVAGRDEVALQPHWEKD